VGIGTCVTRVGCGGRSRCVLIVLLFLYRLFVLPHFNFFATLFSFFPILSFRFHSPSPHLRPPPSFTSFSPPLFKPCLLTTPKQTGKVSPRNTSRSNSDPSASKRASVSTASTNSPAESSPLRRELSVDAASVGSATASMERSCLGGLGEGVLLGSGMEMGSIREE
jgi:hypothetical protein